MSPDIARLSAPGVAVAHCRLPAWEADHYVSRSAASSIGLSFTRQNCVVEVSGRAVARTVEAGRTIVIGPDSTAWLRVEQPSEIIEISADADFRAALAEELSAFPARDLADFECSEHPIPWSAAAQLRKLACRGGAGAELEVEALVRQVYAHIFLERFGGRLRVKGNGALDARRLSRVTEYVDSHLGDEMSLTALAEVAALSTFHFQRSFRRATGCTPHRYVAMRRAERARQRLAAGQEVSDAASASGFKSGRQLRAALRSLL